MLTLMSLQVRGAVDEHQAAGAADGVAHAARGPAHAALQAGPGERLQHGAGAQCPLQTGE